MGLLDSLEALVSELSALGSPLISYLRPGLGTDEIHRETEQRDAVVHSDVVTLFGWHDGFDIERVNADEVQPALLPGFEFLPLNRALDHFELSRSLAGDLAATSAIAQSEVWAATWFPIVGMDGRSVYVSADRAGYGSVWFDPVQDNKYRIFDTLAAALEDVRSKLRAGTLSVTDRGVINGDWVAEAGRT